MSNRNQQKASKANNKEDGGAGLQEAGRVRENATASSEVGRPPRLVYVTTGQNNLPEFRKALATYFEAKYGAAGSFVANGVHWQSEYPKEPEETGDQAIDKRAERRYEILFERALDDEAELKRAHFKMYAELWDLLSDGSQEVVKSSDRYARANEKRDPLKLWKIVKRTHEGSLVGSAAVDRVNAINRFNASSEAGRRPDHTDRFRQAFDEAVDAMRVAGCPVPDEELLALQYLDKLNKSRYSTLKEYLVREAAMHKSDDIYPKTLQAAHEVAIKWRYTPAARASRRALTPWFWRR